MSTYILSCMNTKIKFWSVSTHKILCNVNNKGLLFVWLSKTQKPQKINITRDENYKKLKNKYTHPLPNNTQGTHHCHLWNFLNRRISQILHMKLDNKFIFWSSLSCDRSFNIWAYYHVNLNSTVHLQLIIPPFCIYCIKNATNRQKEDGS